MTKPLINNESSERIEELLASIRPEPGEHYYKRVAKMPWNAKEPSINLLNSKQVGWGAITIVIVLAVIYLLVTPAGHALANEFIQFFTRAESDSVPASVPQVSFPVATRTPESILGLALVPAESLPTPTPRSNSSTPMSFLPEGYLRMSLDEAEEASGMNLYEPYLLPRDYLLTDVAYAAENGEVCMFFRSPQAGSNEFFTICQGKEFQPIPVGASANILNFQVGSYNAELVQGGWYTPNGATMNEWSNHPEAYTIRWDAEDPSIEMFFMLNETFSPAYIAREEMIALAKSMIQCPESENTACSGSHVVPTHQSYPPNVDDRIAYMDVDAVEALTGFDILEPGLLPEGLSFSHARFSSSGQFVWLDYGAFTPDLMRVEGPSLRVSQGVLTGPDNWVEDYPPEAIELVVINGYPGKLYYGNLETQTLNPGQTTPKLTWNRESGSIHVYWVTETMWYSIWFDPGSNGGQRLSKQSLLRIAESLH